MPSCAMNWPTSKNRRSAAMRPIAKDRDADQMARRVVGPEDVSADGASNLRFAVALPFLEHRGDLRLRTRFGQHAVYGSVAFGHFWFPPSVARGQVVSPPPVLRLRANVARVSVFGGLL